MSWTTGLRTVMNIWLKAGYRKVVYDREKSEVKAFESVVATDKRWEREKSSIHLSSLIIMAI